MNTLVDKIEHKFKINLKKEVNLTTNDPLETFNERARKNYAFRYG